jgi:hypothetical protein
MAVEAKGMRFGWNCWLLGLGLLLVSTPVRGETTSSMVVDSPVSPLTPPTPQEQQAQITTDSSVFKGGERVISEGVQELAIPIKKEDQKPVSFVNGETQELVFPIKEENQKPVSLVNGRVPEENLIPGESQVLPLVPPLPRGVRGVAQDLSQAETTPQPQTTPQPATQQLDLSPEIIENSPVLQRWLRQVPNVLDEIRNDPSFRTRLRLGYSHFPSTNGASGFNVGVEDVFLGRTGLTVSGDYQRSFNGKRESFGADLRYYVLPLGSYFNIAPQVGYRNLTTGNYSTDGINVGARLMLALSRTGAADIALTQSFVSPGSGDEVGMTTLSFGYAVTRNLRLSTDIQKQNSRENKDSRVGIVLEWMP